MLFNSFQYLFFFPAVVFLYYSLPHRHRWILLLAASYLFYACWKPGYLILIFASTVVDYWAGLMMEGARTKSRRRGFLFASLAVNLGLLFAFKYFNFFSSSLAGVFAFANLPAPLPQFDILLPVGISFYTFQTLSYTIDVYRGERKAERHFGIFALYVSFFPQLVAGPIERSTRLLPQFREVHRFRETTAVSGLQLILWGLFKKIVIADRLAILVNGIYANPEAFPGPLLVLGTLAFAFQILCDFSGYSDIAIGSARVLGFKLMVNFKAPYFAASIGEFWKRWHISLSTWFRDYLYIPLGGSRVTFNRHLFNLLATFVVSGLWHGANWTFLAWGFLHGSYLIVEVLIGEKRLREVPRGVRVLITFCLTNIAWVFFRAGSIADAFGILAGSMSGWGALADPAAMWALLPKGFSGGQLILSTILVGILLGVESRTDGWRLSEWLGPKPVWARWAFYYAVFGLIILFGEPGGQQFIYFQF